MSHFYGKMKGGRGESTRTGTKTSGMETYAAGWGGAVRVVVFYDEATTTDRYRVEQVSWRGVGVYRLLAEGEVGK